MVERRNQESLGWLKMVAGTAYMIRADLRRQLGWGRSLTEDWELTLRLYARGYKVAYTPYAETPAECVSTFSRFVRQRMRWAEGHSFNVRKHFWSIVRSAHLNLTEKVEFLFYSTYYLQAALFLLGTFSWLLSEIVFKVHVPQWTALLGWSLLFSNLFALPLMNVSGLVLEAAPRKDFGGVLGAVALSFLVVPFQAYAALKGLLEKEEGPWFRTPKTGRITDPISHLKGLLRLRKWLKGPGRNGNGNGHHIDVSGSKKPPRPARRLAWIITAAMFLTLGGLGVSAVNAPPAYAATSWYQHGYSSNTIGNATVALVTSASQTETAAATTLTTTISSSAGDLLLVVVAIPNTTVSLSSVTDSAGNLYLAGSGRNGTASQLLLRVAIHATAVTSVTANFSASTLAVMYVLELSGVNTATPQGTFGANNTSSASPSPTTAVSPNATAAVPIGLIHPPAAATPPAAPSSTPRTP